MKYVKWVNRPGQRSVLQAWVLAAGQVTPPLAAGTEITGVTLWVPPPHVCVQVPYAKVYWQSTAATEGPRAGGVAMVCQETIGRAS